MVALVAAAEVITLEGIQVSDQQREPQTQAAAAVIVAQAGLENLFTRILDRNAPQVALFQPTPQAVFFIPFTLLIRLGC